MMIKGLFTLGEHEVSININSQVLRLVDSFITRYA
jgi:hypothetical protein